MEKHMDNQLIKKNKYFPLFSGSQTYANMGKPKKKRIHRAFHLPIMYPS
jgi:hypothetical protein